MNLVFGARRDRKFAFWDGTWMESSLQFSALRKGARYVMTLLQLLYYGCKRNDIRTLVTSSRRDR